MRNISTDSELQHIYEEVVRYAEKYGRTLPEMRFFILDSMEFVSLLEKGVYPVSPVNIWEGRNLINKRHRIETGQESSLYYEVVQTGNPSYAYLNHTNNAMTQASVMAHVVGHCEFSELNVMHDSNLDRTETVMHLVKKVNLGRFQMGDKNYMQYWNACESILPLLSPNSQFNVENSVETNTRISKRNEKNKDAEKGEEKKADPYSYTMSSLLQKNKTEQVFKNDLKSKLRGETLSRRGYKLRAPCQDIFGFLRNHAPASGAEKSLLDYLYTVHKPQEFIMKTQIMNEGWAMYWEKKIMLDLFKDKTVKGIIDYSKIFSGVCYPRPFFQRNPYHLGYNMWLEIEDKLAKGKISVEYAEETDTSVKENWNKPKGGEPIDQMTHLVETCTDYEFLRRYLDTEMVYKFHLNRIDKRMVRNLGISPKDVVEEDDYYVWLDPEPVKYQMLDFFTHFYRPRIYIIDTDFHDGGLLLLHRNDGQKLKKNWIQPTLKNLNMIWKAQVAIISDGKLFQYGGGRFKESEVGELKFEQVVEKMQKDEKPFKG